MRADLLARDEEVARLRHVLAAGSSGRQDQWLVFTGPVGVGKTALLDVAAAEARGQGLPVLRAAGAQFEAGIGYATLHELLISAFDRFCELPAQLDAALSAAFGLREAPPPAEIAIVQAVLGLLKILSERQPAVLVIDDLQWVDQASATVISAVMRRASRSAAIFVGAYREGRAGFFDVPPSSVAELAPFGEAESLEFVCRHRPDVGAAERLALVAKAEGNPLALTVLPPGDEHGGGAAGARSAPLTARIAEAFDQHVARLPGHAREALLLAALDGTGEVSAVAGGHGLENLEPAETAGVIRVDLGAGRLSFRHPLVRLALVDRSTAQQRQAAHGVLAERAQRDPVRSAWHLSQARTEPDETVAAALERAAELSLRRGDVGLSIRLLTRAAVLTPDQAARARRLSLAAQLSAEVVGSMDSASRLVDDAQLMQAEPAGSLSAAVARAYVMLNNDGAILAVQRLLVDAVNRFGGGFSAADSDLLEALAALSVVCWNSGSAQAWDVLQAFVDRLDPGPPAILQLSCTFLRDPARHYPACLPQLENLIAELADTRDPLFITRVAKACVYADRVEQCRPALRRLVEDSRGGGAPAAAIHALTSLCVDSWLAGDWDNVEEISAEVDEFCRSRGNHRYSQPVQQYLQVMVRQARGQVPPERAAQVAATAKRSAARGSGISRYFYHHAAAFGALGRGDFSAAYRELAEVTQAGTISPDFAHDLWLILDFTEAAQRSGHAREAATHVEAVRQRNVAAISPRMSLYAHASAALLADAARAGQLFEDALAVPGSDQFPFDRARVQLLQGEYLRRQRQLRQARAPLEAALQTFEALGARPWAARAEVERRAAGAAKTRRELAKAALTVKELEIAGLAASGLTNNQIAERLFLSSRTVSGHLYRIFPKLGITSRAALRDALSALEDADERA